MKILKGLNLLVLSVIIFLEAIPFGIKLTWAIDQGLSTSMYHAYFDPMVWGASGDMSPFMCSLLTIAIAVMTLISLFLKTQPRALHTTICVFSWIAVAFSLLPIMVDHYTAIGAVITALLITSAELSSFARSRLNNIKAR